MRIAVALWSAVLIVTAAPFAGAEKLECTYYAWDAESGLGKARVMLDTEGGEITGASYYNAVSGGPDSSALICGFEVSALNGKSIWVRTGDLSRVFLRDERQSVLEIRTLSSGFTLTFDRMQSGYCGFGVLRPVSIRIERGQMRCALQ